MRLLIKQRVFSLSDTFDVYDEQGNAKYYVKNELLSWLHRIHVTDWQGYEVGLIKQNFTLMFPRFEIEIGDRCYGYIQKRFSLFSSKYEIDYNGWRCEGDFMSWNYNVYSGSHVVVQITKELFHWGDTYVVDIANPADEIMALMLVVAIDAANCSNND